MTGAASDDEARDVTINTAQIEAVCRMLVESGDMTPMAVLVLRKLWAR